MKEDFCALWGDGGRRRCLHSVEGEGPRLKDTRTNNQPQILFNHHLGCPNYPKNLHKEHRYHSARVHVVCVRARALHLFMEGRFISGLAVYLFSTNRHCCGILWAHFTNAARPFFTPASWIQKPPYTHTHTPSIFTGWRDLCLSPTLSLAYFSPGSTQAKKA